MECFLFKANAFTTYVDRGNPAGVVLNGDDYTTKQMQQIAAKVGFKKRYLFVKVILRIFN